MKKILLFSLAYYPKHVGGAEVAVKEITDRIPKSDIEFHMVTLRFSAQEKSEETIGNVQVHRVGVGSAYLSKILFIPLAAWKGFSLQKRHHFDAAWAMMSYMLIPIVIMRALGVRIPYVLTLQEGDTFEHMFLRWHIRPLLPLLRRGFRNASVIQTISHFLAEWPKRFGYTGQVEVVPNGANAGDFSPTYTAADLEDIKQKLGKKDGDIYLVTTSRLAYKNGVDTVIQALPMLPVNVKFVVVGDGEDEAALKQLAKGLAVEARVLFVGHVDRTQTPKYRRVCDIFVRPSRSEGMGNSFVSAFAAGLPVIATQEGGIADFLFDAKRNPDKPTTGWAVDKESPEQIAKAVEDIVAHPEKVPAVTEAAKRLAEESYAWDGIAKTMRNKVFSKVLQ